MIRFLIICACVYLPLVYESQAATGPSQTPIASNSETIIAANVAKFNVSVKIKTHEMQIGKNSDKRPEIIRNGCTYSKYPCSLVDYIDILVNEKPLFVPRSVFCDLADLNMGEIKIGNKEATLTLIGGDASESYIVKITFDAERVKRKISASGMLPEEPLQETTYYRRVLGN